MLPDDVVAQTGHLVELFARVSAGVLTERVLARVAGDDVTPALLAVLECVHRRGACSVGDVARSMGVSYAAGSQFAQRLEAKGLAARQEDPADRRRAAIALTPEGRRLVDAVARARCEELGVILERMTPEERQALLRGLDGFLAQALQSAHPLEHLCGRCHIEHTDACVVNRASVALRGRGVRGT